MADSISDILRAQADKAVERIDDSGLLFNVIPTYIGTPSRACWRCDDSPCDDESNGIGLCGPCYAWLHDDSVATHAWRKGI